jgi:hypothetical protein
MVQMRWMLLAVAGALTLLALFAGAFVWASGGSASCDETALASAMHDGIASAEQSGAIELTIEMPSGCKDHHMMDAMPAVSRTWHAMPGGMMMREAQHQRS